MKTAKQRFHAQAVSRVVGALRHRGHRVDPGPYPHGELRVDGVRVAVRGATARTRPHHVHVRNHHYSYRYRFVCVNFHQHGRYPADPPDIWIVAWLEAGRWRFFVLPEAVVHGKATLDLSVNARRHSKSLLAQHAGRWDLLAAACGKKKRAA